MQTPPPPQPQSDRLLTKKAAAEKLAISPRTLDRMVAAGKIVKVFVGASARFRQSEIDRIVAKGI
jgi:excisionase family DNA binding protein